MISKPVFPVFERQLRRFPEYIEKLEAIKDNSDFTKTSFIKLAAILAHDLRNDLCVISMTLELYEVNNAIK